MTFKQRKRHICAPALTITAIVASSLLTGCAARTDLPYHVIHNPVYDRPQNIFVDPVGKGFPALVQQTYTSYQPLPIVRRPVYGGPGASTLTPAVPAQPAIKNPARLDVPTPAGAPALPKQTTLKTVRERGNRLEPVPSTSDTTQTQLSAPLPPTAILSAPLPQAPASPPKADAVVPPDAVEARASTQFRR